MTLSIFTKNVLQKHSFLVNDTTLASNNSSHYRHNLSQRLLEAIMAIDKIRDEKLKCDINRDAALSASLSDKTDKTRWNKLNLHILLFGKYLKKQAKATEDHGKK